MYLVKGPNTVVIDGLEFLVMECGEWESKRTEKITFVHEPVELSQAGEMKQRDAEEMDANKKAKKERVKVSIGVSVDDSDSDRNVINNNERHIE